MVCAFAKYQGISGAEAEALKKKLLDEQIQKLNADRMRSLRRIARHMLHREAGAACVFYTHVMVNNSFYLLRHTTFFEKTNNVRIW